MLKVIVTGPESSGKTSLCNSLSKHFNISFASEFSRKFLAELNRNYTQDNLLVIAKEQLKTDKLVVKNQPLSLHDTDLITIKIWSEYKYGNCNSWVLKQVEKQKKEKRFYLLCKPDIPWESDPLRENPNNREELFDIYKKEIKSLKHDFFVIKGENRLESAIKRISELIAQN